MPATRIGFVGLGAIGEPMARRVLEAGYPLVVHNRTPGKTARLIGQGATKADSLRQLAQAVDMMLLCVTDGDAVESVVFGPGGLAEGSRPGQLVVDLSTVHPLATQAIARKVLELHGLHWVDAPVSGGPVGAAAGTLAVMAGGADEDVERARAVLGCFARQVTHMGGVGCGQLTKACNQMINVANAAAIAEAMNLASRFGVDHRRLPAALAGGFADSGMLRHFGPKMADGSFAGNSAVTLKDLGIVEDLGRRTNSAMPVVGLITSFYRLLAARGHQHDGVAGVARMYAEPGFLRRGANHDEIGSGPEVPHGQL